MWKIFSNFVAFSEYLNFKNSSFFFFIISGIETLRDLVPGLTPKSSEAEVCEMTVKYLKFMKTQVEIEEVDQEFLMAQIF